MNKNLLLLPLLILLVAPFAFAAPPDYATFDNYYKFENTLDDDMNNANLTAGVASFDGTTFKMGNYSRSYTGGSADTATLPAPLSANFTIATWFYMNNPSSLNGGLISLTTGCADPGSMSIEYFGSQGKFYIFTDQGNGGITQALNSQWYRLVVTQENDNTTLYLDGNYVDSQPNTNPLTKTGLAIGGTPSCPRYFDGYLDDVIIEDGRAWTAAEVTSDYNSGNGVNYAPSGCTPSWSCSSYAACAPNNVSACTAVTDANNCGTPFGGNLSTYDQACSYVPPTPVEPTNVDGLITAITALFALAILIVGIGGVMLSYSIGDPKNVKMGLGIIVGVIFLAILIALFALL